MSHKLDYDIASNFIKILTENKTPDLHSYIQNLEEILHSIQPTTRRDQSRLSMAMECLRNIRREVKRIEERAKTLEEIASIQK